MSAFNTANERDLLKSRGLQYHPDLVIVHFVLNDVEPDIFKEGPKVEFFEDYLALYQQPDRLSEYSRLWGWLRQRYLRSVLGRTYIEQSLNSYRSDASKFRQCFEALQDIQHICRKNNISLLVVIFPFFYDLDGSYPFLPIHEQIRKACHDAGIPVLDLLPFYRRYHGPELWVHPVDQHPNEIAHEIAARAMYDYLSGHTEYGLSRR